MLCLGKVQGTGSTAEVKGSISQNLRESMQGLFSESWGKRVKPEL